MKQTTISSFFHEGISVAAKKSTRSTKTSSQQLRTTVSSNTTDRSNKQITQSAKKGESSVRRGETFSEGCRKRPVDIDNNDTHNVSSSLSNAKKSRIRSQIEYYLSDATAPREMVG